MSHYSRYLVAVTALLVVACGPVYKTEYRFIAPAEPQAQSCVSQCETDQRQCRASADLQAEHHQQRCERDASADYELCFTRAGNDQERNRCQRKSCSASADDDKQLCEADHRACYQGCGGVVKTDQVCTFNCP